MLRKTNYNNTLSDKEYFLYLLFVVMKRTCRNTYTLLFWKMCLI